MNIDAHSNQRHQDVAYVLHSQPYQNTSMLVEVFTREHGRFGLVAKGVKRPKSRMYGVIQPLQCLFLSWGGRSELKTLYSAEIESYKSDKLSGERLYMGLYVNELLMRLLHKGESHTRMFDAYQTCLQLLAKENDCEPVLRYFEIQLLEELGYGVNLDYDYLHEDGIQADLNYIYVPEHGFTRQTHQPADELLVRGDTLIALSNRNLQDMKQKKEAKLLLRMIIEYHLEGRPLKTRELFQSKSRFSQD